MSINPRDIALLDQYHQNVRTTVDDRLGCVIEEYEGQSDLRQLFTHSLDGGKRVRPMLTMIAAEVYDIPPELAVNHGVIVELIHNACVTADTKIQRSNGDAVPIVEIETGEEVLAFDPAARQYEPRTVTKYHENGVCQVVTVSLADRSLTCTSDHELLAVKHADSTATELLWVEAGTLTTGDRIVAARTEGSQITDNAVSTAFGVAEVQAVDTVSEPQETYDIEVEELHNYVANGVVTHNTLVADDYADDDASRRGLPTLWKIIERLPFISPDQINPRTFTILTQNGLLALALQLAEHPEEVRAMGETVQDVYEGFYLEGRLAFDRLLNNSYEAYIDVNRQKTGGLFSLACWLPSTVSEYSPVTVQAARKYGEATGILYQISDDICDDDCPSCIDDPEAQLEQWHGRAISHLVDMPVDSGRQRWLLESTPAWCALKMLEQEAFDDINPSFETNTTAGDLDLVPDYSLSFKPSTTD